jgi:hypothetical protein
MGFAAKLREKRCFVARVLPQPQNILKKILGWGYIDLLLICVKVEGTQTNTFITQSPNE